MKITAFGRRWTIRWQWALVSLAASALLASLSMWQLQRATEKTQTLARIAAWQAQGAVGLTRLAHLVQAGVGAGEGAVDGLQVDFEARWLAPAVWLIDNRIVDGRAGYDVLIAVVDRSDPRAAGLAVLLNLGWIEAPAARDVLPFPAIPTQLRVQGIFRTDVGGLLLGTNLEDRGSWPMRIQQVDVDALSPLVPVALVRGLVHQQQGSPFHIHYRPVVLPAERHRAYALQWALLALAVIVVALAAGQCKERPHEQP